MFNLRSLPNFLALFRIVLTPLLFWLILTGQAWGYLAAVGVLLLMGISDFLDGRIARRLQAVSPLGVFLDTISDKIFVAGALLPMIQVGLLPGWIALLIIVREFIISGLRSFAASAGEVISAGPWGKQKLAITVVALMWRLLAATLEGAGPLRFAATDAGPVAFFLSLWPVAMTLAVIWTVFSGVEYLWKAWPLLRGSWSPPVRSGQEASTGEASANVPKSQS
jgi:CDP-diacylglycerol--glycerol-3-phosphate 3-phosphatidyltransferase